MLLYFVLLVASGVSRYQGQSNSMEPKVAPPKNYDITDTSMTDMQDKKKRKIAEAILLLIEDEIKIHNLNLITERDDTNAVILKDNGQDVVKVEDVSNEKKYADEVLVQQFADLLVPKNVYNWSNIVRGTNRIRKQRKSLKSLQRYRVDQVSRRKPSVELVDVGKVLLKNESKVKDPETLIPTDRSDVKDGTDDEVAELQPEEGENGEREKIFHFDTDLPPSNNRVPSPFRGIFLSSFNSGFADFENSFYFTAAPSRLLSSPVLHVLDCSSSSSSRSSCDNKICTVQCEDGNKIVLQCASNSVVVRARSVQRKLSYEVTCGTNNQRL